MPGRVALASVVYSDGWIGYDGLVDLGYRTHFGVEHRDSVFVARRGIRREFVYLHLKRM